MLSFKDYCLEVAGIRHYQLLLPDEFSTVEDNYKHYCTDNKIDGEFELD